MFFIKFQPFYTCMAEKVDLESLFLKYDRLDNRPWLYMTAAVKKWEKEVGAVLESFETTRTQVEFLLCLVKFTKEGRTITQKDVARALGRAENTASGVFRNLEKKGYITRTVSEDDQRAKHIAVTEKGYRLVEKAVGEVVLVDERLFPDERDNEELIRLLKKHL